jgi:serine-type D-Ala-D-Ala carboxypeptidase (penicillin-binding protein 5/6)
MPLASCLHSLVLRARIAALIAAIALLPAILLPLATGAQEVPELKITSTNYILIDADTGEIYAQRGAHERRAPASLTKIFTAIEVIETAPGDVAITTRESDLVSDMASQVGFSPGETFTVEELLYGMMLPSGNDAARALARGLGAQEGDDDEQARTRFLDRLNQRLLDMGLTDTHLVNPDGWGVPDHYSSAYDLAAFTMYALHYPRFVRTFSTGAYETADGSYEFKNNNRMLRTYEGIIGGKTGYDDDAGWCLVNVAERDGSRMIAVTMNGVAPDDWYDDNRVLLDYGFEQKALRAESAAPGGAEFVRYRDPDAALILAMASAGGTVGEARTSASAAGGQTDVALAPPAALDSPKFVPIPSGAIGASSAGLLIAAGVAAALTLVQAAATWRLRPHSTSTDAVTFNDAVPSAPEPAPRGAAFASD